MFGELVWKNICITEAQNLVFGSNNKMEAQYTITYSSKWIGNRARNCHKHESIGLQTAMEREPRRYMQ